MTVNMDNDQEDLYLNLTSLLKDICRFLEANTMSLSPSDKKKAELLIERSKKQLQTIAKIAASKPLPETEGYVVMKPVLPSNPTIVETEPCKPVCRFQDLPARDAAREIKYGTLIRRKRFWNTKVYAVIHENWLLIYGSSKDLKPDCVLDLRHYEAKEDESDLTLHQLEISKDDSLKKNSLNFKMASSFKVFHSTSPEKKFFNFVATTYKDMLQWVVNINRRHDRAVRESKNFQEEQNYEVLEDFQGSDDENIYNEPDIINLSLRGPPVDPKAPVEDDRPPVPPTRPMGVRNSPSQLHASSESVVSCQEEEVNSFGTSGDEEDQTYDVIDTIRKDIVKEISENIRLGFKVPPPPPQEFTVDLHAHDNSTYENNNIIQRAELHTVQNTVESKSEATTKLKVTERNVHKSSTSELKILTPKHWKPVSKSDLNKNRKTPQIPKNKSIRESLKNPLEHKSIRESPKNPLESKIKPLKEASSPETKQAPPVCIVSPKISPRPQISNIVKEPPPVCNESPKISPRPHEFSNMVRIFRNRFTNGPTSPCSLETFSKSPKVETFQASPTKESPPSDFSRSPNRDLRKNLRPIDTLIAGSYKDDKNRDGKPMVLLQPSLECEESVKKSKKSPVVPRKPNKIAKRLPF